MKKHWACILVLLAGATVPCRSGSITYWPIPAADSDANSGIGNANQYTTAIDGGNSAGTDRVINGITLYSLGGGNESSLADGAVVNALSGNLANGAGSSATVQADGVLREVMFDMTYNNAANDNSQQEIVLDPETLQAGVTYDLRVYICNSGGQNRQVNLSFTGDGEDAVETGWFNEDDARSSAGGFTDANQVYLINYRFTWDGDTTPGITISQKSGEAPFCLYALTNQVVPADAVAAADEGASVGLINAESDQVGVASDEFYGSDSLNSNGRWVDVEQWGKCWQPANVPNGWRPYTNGTWRDSEECGWTFVSDEPWAWACYHFGRWCKVRTGCGWAWVPGKVWAASWVSWRKGSDNSCSCIGWAPLPPQASCELNVGISASVDQRCDIGPDYYTFVNIRDLGSDSYAGCGCIYEHSRNVAMIRETVNVTNVFFNRTVTYCGGPDLKWCNERIRKFGGKEIAKISVKRFDDPAKIKGGKFSHMEGNQLALLSPRVRGDKNPKRIPKTAERIASNKIDKGWGLVNDKNQEKQLRKQIAQENEGRDGQTAKATLPASLGKGRGVNKTQVQNDAGEWRPGGAKNTKNGTEGGAWHPGKSLKRQKGNGTGWSGAGAGKGKKTRAPNENAVDAGAPGAGGTGEEHAGDGRGGKKHNATGFKNANTRQESLANKRLKLTPTVVTSTEGIRPKISMC